MIKYDDLLSVPYKQNGRNKSGMDCYGLVIECCKRAGVELKDIVYKDSRVATDELTKYTAGMNVREISSIKSGCIIQCEYASMLHIAFALDKKVCIHATHEGVRITPVCALKNVKYFEVVK